MNTVLMTEIGFDKKKIKKKKNYGSNFFIKISFNVI